MDYYEELGLKRTATVQEIRQAYRVMARLVHPDGQAHKPVREMAERQMKRLNEILAILTTEQTRRMYDAELTAASPLAWSRAANSNPAFPWKPIPKTMMARPLRWWRGPKSWQPRPDSRLERLPDWVQPVLENWFWISLTLVLVGVGGWYAAQVRSETAIQVQGASDADAQPPSHEPRPKPRDPKSQNTEVRKAPQGSAGPDSRPLAAERAATDPAGQDSTQSLAPVPSNSPASSYPTLRPEPSNFALPAGKPAPANAVTAKGTAKSHAASFVGNWQFVPDPKEKLLTGMYPANYVEFLLAEVHGRLWGRYRAQYQVADRAVSPEVSFQLQGDAPARRSASFKWTSADGAKGEVEMTLIGPDLMKVAWWTTEFGRHTTLASGTAKLVRQEVR